MRIYVERAFTRPCTYIWLEIRKEAGHEQWLAALRNNVVFVGSFYLPMAQECSLQSASKFIPVLRNAIGSFEYFMLVRFLHEDFKDVYSNSWILQFILRKHRTFQNISYISYKIHKTLSTTDSITNEYKVIEKEFS